VDEYPILYLTPAPIIGAWRLGLGNPYPKKDLKSLIIVTVTSSIIFIVFSVGECMPMGKPVLMDFYADWCGPCRLQTPRIEELKKRMGEAVEVKKINVDQHMDLANRYAIQVVPTLVIEKDGKVVRRLEGLTDTGTLESILKPLVD
jgi:thioredoxin 1